MALRTAYSRPQLSKRNFEQVSLFLTGHAWVGNQQARELLEFLFPRPGTPCPNEDGKSHLPRFEQESIAE